MPSSRLANRPQGLEVVPLPPHPPDGIPDTYRYPGREHAQVSPPFHDGTYTHETRRFNEYRITRDYSRDEEEVLSTDRTGPTRDRRVSATECVQQALFRERVKERYCYAVTQLVEDWLFDIALKAHYDRYLSLQTAIAGGTGGIVTALTKPAGGNPASGALGLSAAAGFAVGTAISARWNNWGGILARHEWEEVAHFFEDGRISEREVWKDVGPPHPCTTPASNAPAPPADPRPVPVNPFGFRFGFFWAWLLFGVLLLALVAVLMGGMLTGQPPELASTSMQGGAPTRTSGPNHPPCTAPSVTAAQAQAIPANQRWLVGVWCIGGHWYPVEQFTTETSTACKFRDQVGETYLVTKSRGPAYAIDDTSSIPHPAPEACGFLTFEEMSARTAVAHERLPNGMYPTTTEQYRAFQARAGNGN